MKTFSLPLHSCDRSIWSFFSKDDFISIEDFLIDAAHSRVLSRESSAAASRLLQEFDSLEWEGEFLGANEAESFLRGLALLKEALWREYNALGDDADEVADFSPDLSLPCPTECVGESPDSLFMLL